MAYDYNSPDGNASHRSTWKERYDMELREHGRNCEMCGHKTHPDEMKKHVQSGNYVCEGCLPGYIEGLCDGDEINPQFV